MKATYIALVAGLGHLANASPMPLPLPQAAGAGSTSCPAESLTQETWDSLGIAKFLDDFAAANLTGKAGDNIQGLSGAFGAPNFFCGIDQFCNAGQPCLPIQTPAWYGMVAIQNWNSYMNSINTAITFASSIVGLTLPGVVQDFFPDPKDDVTDMKTVYKIFTGVLGAIPFTGPLSTAAGAVVKGVNFVNDQIQPPPPTDRFFAWSNMASSIATIVSDYQKATLQNFESTIDGPVAGDRGILAQVRDGRFLGTSRNVTQSQLQSVVTEAIKRRSIGLVLTAQNFFVQKITNLPVSCDEVNRPSNICTNEADGSVTLVELFRVNQSGQGKGAISSTADQVDLLTSKYGFTKEQFTTDVVDCFLENNSQQLADPFGAGIPLDPSTKCLFNVPVCIRNAPTEGGDVLTTCQGKGVPIS